MITRKNRFHGHNSLDGAYKKGRAVRGESISLRYLATKRADYRLAVVVSKKVSKSAVKRNRIRRRIYEITRVWRKEQAAPWPYDVIISVFDEKAAAIPAQDLQASVVKMLQKIGS